MANANIVLLHSILWNLREITKLAEIIKETCGDIDCTSWRYPLASCSELEIYKLLQNNKNLDNYTYILELTYDRLLYIFNLIIKYLESNKSMENFRPGKNVRRPKTLSLASVMYMIWERIKAQVENTNQKILADKSETKYCYSQGDIVRTSSTIYTQSDVCSISVCSCCEMVQEFVTQLILEVEKVMEKLEFPSAISDERKNMREALVEMTNWSATTKWLSAVMKDFSTICQKLEQELKSSRKLRCRIDSGEKKMKSKVEKFEEETRNLENRIGQYETKISAMKKEIEELTKKIQTREEVKAKNLEMANLSIKFEKKIEELKRNYEEKLMIQEENAKKEVEKEKKLKKKLGQENKKREKVEAENNKLIEEILQLKNDLNLVNSTKDEEINSLMIKCSDLEKNMKNIKEENSSLNLVLSQKQILLEDYSKRIMEAFPQLGGQTKSIYKASGNPRTDMENQIEANNLRIDSLRLENEKLKKTLEKMTILIS